MAKDVYRIKEAAEIVGIHPTTLRRWILAGKVADVRRDRNGWRVFSQRDIARIEAFANQHTDPVQASDSQT
ncbi:MAG: MerR family transcriptional regulator [Kiritimatiellae bacterium]|nr:MerR family transcriptional regulator [Kiritimatiellia bacterium]